MAQVYQKREVVLLDMPNRIDKNMIDAVLQNNGYKLSSSKIDNRPNVEFINADVANDVKKFFENKELIYNNRPFKFSLKGNRFIIAGMNEVSFDQIRNFFQSYGEVNNVYYTKRYFATLTSIQQAIELVEQVRTIVIDNVPVEIKYAFDHNIGNAVSSNKNFKLRVKDGKTGDFAVKNKESVNNNNSNQNINIQLSKPINIELGGNNIKNANSCSRLNDVDKYTKSNRIQTNQHSGNQQNYQKNQDKSNRRRRGRRNRSLSSQDEAAHKLSNLDLNKQTNDRHVSRSNVQNGFKKSEQFTGSKLALNIDTKVNSLKMSNPNLPLFSKGPSQNNFTIFEKLDHKNDQFKSINYLDNKIKQQEKQQEKQHTHITTTYFDPLLNRERQQNDLPTVLPFQKISTNQNSNNLPSSSNNASINETKIFKPSSTVTPLNSQTMNTSQVKTKSPNEKSTNHSTIPNLQSTKPKTNATESVNWNNQDKQKNHFATKQEPKKERVDNCNII